MVTAHGLNTLPVALPSSLAPPVSSMGAMPWLVTGLCLSALGLATGDRCALGRGSETQCLLSRRVVAPRHLQTGVSSLRTTRGVPGWGWSTGGRAPTSRERRARAAACPGLRDKRMRTCLEGTPPCVEPESSKCAPAWKWHGRRTVAAAAIARHQTGRWTGSSCMCCAPRPSQAGAPAPPSLPQGSPLPPHSARVRPRTSRRPHTGHWLRGDAVAGHRSLLQGSCKGRNLLLGQSGLWHHVHARAVQAHELLLVVVRRGHGQ
mmetsp:Transcript_41/g.142  ORF Transcript_41/g.142 Transcript_41/m.142 type:complete len:262 (+) Transcript_41:397-1182(+)